MSAASISRSLPSFDASPPARREAVKADARTERPFELPADRQQARQEMRQDSRQDLRQDDAPAGSAPVKSAPVKSGPDRTASDRTAPSKHSATKPAATSASTADATPAKEAGESAVSEAGAIEKPIDLALQGEIALGPVKTSNPEDALATGTEPAAVPQPALPTTAPLFLAQIQNAPAVGNTAENAGAGPAAAIGAAAVAAGQALATAAQGPAASGAGAAVEANQEPAADKTTTDAGAKAAAVAPGLAIFATGEAKLAGPVVAGAPPVAAVPTPATKPDTDIAGLAATETANAKLKAEGAAGEAASARPGLTEAGAADKTAAASASSAVQANPDGRPAETAQQVTAPVLDAPVPVGPTTARNLPGLLELDAALLAGQPPQPSAVETGRPTPIHVVPIEIGMQALAGNKRFDIRLDPGELGRVDVRLEISDDGDVSARLTVDRVETLHLLQRDSRTLERAFEQAGLKTSESGVQISLRDPSDQSGSRQGGQQDDDGARSRKLWTASGEDMALPAENTPLRRAARLGGVDLSI